MVGKSKILLFELGNSVGQITVGKREVFVFNTDTIKGCGEGRNLIVELNNLTLKSRVGLVQLGDLTFGMSKGIPEVVIFSC